MTMTPRIVRSLSLKLSNTPGLVKLRRRLTDGFSRGTRRSGFGRTRRRTKDDNDGRGLVFAGLAGLPYDVLTVIYEFLDARDIARLSRVCRALRSISIDPTTWAVYFKNMMMRTNVLVFDEITDPISQDINEPTSQEFHRIGRAIVRGERLRREWGPISQQNRDNILRNTTHELEGAAVAASCPVHTAVAKAVPLDRESARLASPLLSKNMQFFAAQTFVPMPDRADLFADMCLLSPGDYDDPDRCGKITIFPQYRPGTHFMSIHQGMFLPFVHRIPHRDIQFSFHLAPYLMKLDLPDRSCLNIPVRRYGFPGDWKVIEHIIDTRHKRNYALVLRPGSHTLGVVVVLDPRSGLTVAFNTDFVYNKQTTAAGVRLSNSGEAFDVFTDDMGIWTHSTYSIAAISPIAQAFSSAIASIPSNVSPVATFSATTSLWTSTVTDIYMYHLHSVSLAMHWTIPAPVQILPTHDEGEEKIERFCHILLFRDRGSPLFVVIQYYTSATFLSSPSFSSPSHSPSSSTSSFSRGRGMKHSIKHPITIGPHAPATHFIFNPLQRNVASMRHHRHDIEYRYANSVRDLPLLTLSVSFTHIAWVELVPTMRSNSSSGFRLLNMSGNPSGGQQPSHERRALRVVQFADMDPWKGVGDSMGMDTEASGLSLWNASARELDIPARVLNDSYNIYLEPALASVFVLANDSIMHKFRFA